MWCFPVEGAIGSLTPTVDTPLLQLLLPRICTDQLPPSPGSRAVAVALDFQTGREYLYPSGKQAAHPMVQASVPWIGWSSCRHWQKGPGVFSQLLGTGM